MALRPISSENSYKQNWNEVNNMVRQLNKEQVTKTYKQAGGNAILEGKLPYEGGYGSLYYDQNQVPRILIGIDPDGEINLVVSKPDVDVLSLF